MCSDIVPRKKHGWEYCNENVYIWNANVHPDGIQALEKGNLRVAEMSTDTKNREKEVTNTMNPIDYMRQLCYQRVLPCLEKNAVVSEDQQSSVCFVMCGSEPVMENVPMERVKGLHAELLFPPETTESEIFAVRNILADEFQCAYTWRGIHWKNDTVSVNLRVDRAPEPLNEIELFCNPDDSSSLKLWNFQRAIRIHDPSGRFKKLQGELGYYLEDTWNEKLIACWFMLNFRVSHDFGNSVRRRRIQRGSAHQYLGVSLCWVLRFCFLINREYPPVVDLTCSNLLPKFLRDEVARLPILGRKISLLLDRLETRHTLVKYFRVISNAFTLYQDFLSENKIDLGGDFIFGDNDQRIGPERSDDESGIRKENPLKEDDTRWIK